MVRADNGVLRDIERPSLPPIVFCAICLWAACSLCLVLHDYVVFLESFAALMIEAVMSVLVSIGCIVLRKRLPAIGLAMLGCCVGMLLATSAMMITVHIQKSIEQGGGVPQAAYVALGDSVAGDFGEHCEAVCVSPGASRARVRLNLPKGQSCRCWDEIIVSGTPKIPSGASADYYWTQGLSASLNVSKCSIQTRDGVIGALQTFRGSILASLDKVGGRGAVLLQAMLVGYRHNLAQSDDYAHIKIAGLAHLVAVSGAHLALLVALLGLVGRWLGVPRKALSFIQAAFIVMFVVLCSLAPSALRAGMMAVCVLLAQACKRRSSSLNSWSACVMVMIATDPFLALDLSFDLSAAATLSIVGFARYASSWFAVLLHGRFGFVSDALGLTFASNMLTLPFSIPTFGYVSLIAPFANILAIPFFTLLCGGGFLAASVCACIPQFDIVLRFLCLLATLFLDGVSCLASIPYAAIPSTGSTPILLVLAAAALIVSWILWPTPKISTALSGMAIAVALGLLFVFVAPRFSGNQIIMLDVGQGDATVVRSGTSAVLIDTGTNNAQVLRGLASHGITRLDAVLITHPDDDHCGSLSSILSTVPTDRILVAADLLTCADDNCRSLVKVLGDTQTVGLHDGDTFSFGPYMFEVLWPNAFKEDGGNGDSLVVVCESDCNNDGTADWSALFTGDAESEVLDSLDKSGKLHDVDILKVGHHGSAASVNEDNLHTLKPEIALIGVGRNNRYGHPKQETLDTLAKNNVTVFRTDENGDICCDLSSHDISVVCAVG